MPKPFICVQCGREVVRQSRGRGRFCDPFCYTAWRTGHPERNRGLWAVKKANAASVEARKLKSRGKWAALFGELSVRDIELVRKALRMGYLRGLNARNRGKVA